MKTFTLDNGGGLQLRLMDWGATWLSAQLHGQELLLGHASPEAWRAGQAYLGAVVGRIANRIAGARFTLGGREHRLTPNEGANQLHGGPGGFHHQAWRADPRSSTRIDFHLDSPAGDQGFPSRLLATASYRLTGEHGVEIHFEVHNAGAEATIAGLTSHAYFSLDGPQRGVLGQTLTLRAPEVLPVDAALLPTGERLAVAGTPFDFRAPRRIAEGLAQGHAQLAVAGGYDHCWLLTGAAEAGPPGLRQEPAARLVSADERCALTLDTSYPALQLYGGQYLGLQTSPGRGGQPLCAHAGLALEPQYPPDTANRLGEAGWPQAGCVIQPGQTQTHWLRLAFERR